MHYRPLLSVSFATAAALVARDATIINLDHVGYDGWTELRTRPDRDEGTVQQYKTKERIKVEDEGYTIIANVGDQPSDLDGGFAEQTYLLPDPFYRIP